VVDDAALLPGHRTVLSASLTSGPFLGMRRDIERTPVDFWVGAHLIATTLTDDEGHALVVTWLPEDAGDTVEARARVGQTPLAAPGAILRWEPDALLIVLDIDNTIADTEYGELLFEEQDRDSEPLPAVLPVLHELAGRSHLIYLTGRPRFLINKTRDWLHVHDFPPGLLYTGVRLRDTLRPARFKRDKLNLLQAQWPNVLVGIGNRSTDARAYTGAGMLALILNDDRPIGQEGFVVTLPGWRSVGRFFADNDALLSDPAALAQALRDADNPPELVLPPDGLDDDDDDD